TGLRSFHVVPALTVRRDGRDRFERERHGEVLVLPAQRELGAPRIGVTGDGPVLYPDAKRRSGRAREPERAARETLRDQKAAAVNVRHGEVRHPNLGRCPCRGTRLGGGRCQRDPEESELESEVAAVRAVEVAREVPPFAPELVMARVIAWERKLS